MYLRSGGIGPSARTHKRAPTRRVHIITRDGPTFAGLFRVLQQSTNEILLGNPRRPAGAGAANAGRGTRENGQRTLQQARRAEGLKLLNCFPFIFQPPAAGQLKLPPPYMYRTSRERTGVNKMRELVNLTARRPFPAPPRRPFSQTRRQINEVRYICASPHCCT